MCCVKSFWFILVIVLFSVVQSKEICDYVDVECMTNGARNVLKILVAGITDLMEPVDPLLIGDYKGEIPDTKYTLFHPKMIGLKNCHVTEFTYQPDRITYEYDLFCPQLVLQYGYEAKGIFGPLKIDGNGNVNVTLIDYFIILKGHSENFVSEDGKPRARVTDFVLETVPKGNITFEVNDIVRGNKEKSAQALAYVNEHALDIEKYLRAAVIQEFMKVFIDRVNIVFSNISLQEILPKV